MYSNYSGDTTIPEASRDILDKQRKLLGSSIIGLEIHKIIESTKILIKERPEIDATNVPMTGLSWGGLLQCTPPLYVRLSKPRQSLPILWIPNLN